MSLNLPSTCWSLLLLLNIMIIMYSSRHKWNPRVLEFGFGCGVIHLTGRTYTTNTTTAIIYLLFRGIGQTIHRYMQLSVFQRQAIRTTYFVNHGADCACNTGTIPLCEQNKTELICYLLFFCCFCCTIPLCQTKSRTNRNKSSFTNVTSRVERKVLSRHAHPYFVK